MATSASLLDFIFRDEQEAHFDELRQGDLLLKTAELANAIGQGHRHYADHPDYTHFLVLTQSCDLAARGSGSCRADYLTICAVKPLSSFLERKLAGVFYGDSGPLRIGRKGLQRTAQQVLNKLISNTHEEVFFLDANCARSLVDRSCAFLQLSVALRVEHFPALQKAKQAEMSDIFAAKLGWMTGNLYSRIGTPDVSELHPENAEAYIEDFTNELLSTEGWLTEPVFKSYKKLLNEVQIAAAEKPITVSVARAILASLPEPIDDLTSAIVDVLMKNKFVTDTRLLEQVRFRMANDAKLRRIASSIG